MEIANQMHTISEGLKKLGVDTKTLNYYPSYLGYKNDYTLDVCCFKYINEADIETKKIAAKLIDENNIFHFHFGTTLTLDNSDLKILKSLNKKVIMHHWGSDVRRISIAKKINPYVETKNLDEESIKRNLDFLSKYIDCCIVADWELYCYVKDFYKNVAVIPQAIEIEKYDLSTKSIKENKKFLIVHAPTNRTVKGTKFIIDAVEKLKLKYDFKFKLVENFSHEEAKKIYQEADLIIDQLLLGEYGLFTLECMAMGKPVICYISNYMKSYYPKDLPVISANCDEIETKLEFILNNRDMLKNIGFKGRKYVEKYHDHLIVSKRLLDLYKGSDNYRV
ncbi:glycosyltransferase family 4 protein [Clostridium sp. P21]|uniref:Glycosyltransferase family 4 protein n=1 Tax=Clostridium muellerianum TaxID=2716538 RepID=A0A7Y0EEC6_9CLOT|nr:glycosyltransferase family 4 protein [Clostridium muellerianum]